MQSTRYEQYANLNSKIPVSVHPYILRSSVIRSLQTNWHENLEIQYIISGEGYVLLNGERRNVVKGDIIIANSNVVHYTGSETQMEYSCVIVDSLFCRNAGIDHTALHFAEYINNCNVQELYRKIIEVYCEEENETKIARIQVAVLNLLIEIRKNYTNSEKISGIKRENFEIVEKCINFIHKNYHEKLTLDYISKNIYCNKYSLSRYFKAVTSFTVIDYINYFRCKMASKLISDGTPVNIAAEKCGFNNLPYFTQTFKHCMGKLPKEYKK